MNDSPLTPQDYSIRRGELSAFGRALNSSRTLARLTVVVSLITLMTIVGVAWIPLAMFPVNPKTLLTIALVLILLGLFFIWIFTNRHFIEPDLAFRKWLQQVCDGNLDARINLPEQHRHYKELNFHTRNLSSSLARLSSEMEAVVESQTRRLDSQRRMLEMLLRLTDSISGESEKTMVIGTVARHLANWFGDSAVSGYLVEKNRLDRVAYLVTDSQKQNDPSHSVQVEHSDHCIEQSNGDRISTDAFVPHISWSVSDRYRNSEKVSVPFFRGKDPAGMLIIDLASKDGIDKVESERVLQAVSEQLTLFTNKITTREQAERVRLIGERTRLAGDMHDSLAQTLLAVRYKATVLQETLAEAGSSVWADDVGKIAATIGEANTEIRDLMREYRSPLSEHRSVDSIQLSIEQFRESSGMQVFFHSENPLLLFTPREESVVQRIIGEALINAQKYAEANTIRVFLQYLPDGTRTVLIEDDGQGFKVDQMLNLPRNAATSGNHIGLSIMQERALSIGAIFSIESELGEGTQVSLKLPPLLDTAATITGQT